MIVLDKNNWPVERPYRRGRPCRNLWLLFTYFTRCLVRGRRIVSTRTWYEMIGEGWCFEKRGKQPPSSPSATAG